MVKIPQTVTLDFDLISEVKLRGLKLSTIINELLKGYLDANKNQVIDEKKKTKQELKMLIAQQSAELIENKKKLDEIQKKEDEEFKEWR